MSKKKSVFCVLAYCEIRCVIVLKYAVDNLETKTVNYVSEKDFSKWAGGRTHKRFGRYCFRTTFIKFQVCVLSLIVLK